MHGESKQYGPQKHLNVRTAPLWKGRAQGGILALANFPAAKTFEDLSVRAGSHRLVGFGSGLRALSSEATMV